MDMNRILLLITFIIFHAFSLNAQKEIGKKTTKFSGFPIVAEKEPLKVEEKPKTTNPFSNSEAINTSPLFRPSTDLFTEKKIPAFVIDEKKSLPQEPIFINPHSDLLDKLNGKSKPASENFKAISGNQDLGSFKLDSKFVNILYRDFGEVDGDLIRVYLNGIVIYEQIFLDFDFKGIEISLQKGFNKIDFEALNQGTSGPNTAEFRVYDDNKKLVSNNQWNLVTGFKASIIVTKE